MAYAPGVQHRGGELLAAGIMQGVEGLADGILQNAQKRREKEQLQAAIATFQPMMDKLAPGAGVKLDKDLPKEAIPQVIQLASQFEQQQREAPLRELQIENERLKQRLSIQDIESAATNAAAAKAAGNRLGPQLPDAGAVGAAFKAGAPIPTSQMGNAGDAMTSYLREGGTDTRMLAELGGLAQAQARGAPRAPGGLVNFGNDAYGRPVQGLVDAQGNVSTIKPPTAEDQTAQPFQIGGQTFYKVGGMVMNSEGKPVRGEQRGMDPISATIALSKYQSALEQAEAKTAWNELEATAEEQRVKARQRANLLAEQLGYQRPYPADDVTKPAGKQGTQPAAQPRQAAPASPYSTADVRAELKRRGLITE